MFTGARSVQNGLKRGRLPQAERRMMLIGTPDLFYTSTLPTERGTKKLGVKKTLYFSREICSRPRNC